VRRWLSAAELVDSWRADGEINGHTVQQTIGFVIELQGVTDRRPSAVPRRWSLCRAVASRGGSAGYEPGSADDAAPRGFEASADQGAAVPADIEHGAVTLCAGCGRMVWLTNAQAVIAEAELIALDVVSLAFCSACRAALPS
jgi:hypothetical protein